MEENMNIEMNEELLQDFRNMENVEDGIQTTFNEDSLEEMNDESVVIENENEEEVEGIGAVGFSMRTTKPSGNLNFMTTSTGGWSTCIKGSPNDPNATVLSNCVGYASSRFNEIINLARGTSGCTYKTLNCNAENFPERAAAAGLQMGSTPRRGAIICWQKGSLSSSDGAGHVEVVERVDSNNQIFTSASNYGGTAFYNSTRTNNNGRWSLNSPYAFRCFIYLPADVQAWVDGSSPAPAPTPSDKYNIGDKVVINGALYVNSNAATPAGSVSNKVTNITRKNPGSAHPYNTTGDLGWMDESSIRPYEEPKPTPTPTPVSERKGLDISSWQQGISFDAIKNSEYNQFVILRGGFTGWGTGVSYNKDSCFEGFYADAKARGIPVGAYWYSCANTYDKGVAEANYFYENCLKGKQFEYPVYMDVEDSHWQVGNKDGVTAAIKGFCETLENKKYYVGIYASDISGFQEKMYVDQLKDYDKWVARYGSKPQYVTSYGMWQTASNGRINGYGENLDTDIAYQDYETIIKNAKLNGFDGEQPTPPTPPTPPAPTPSYKYNIGDRVVINGDLYVSSDASRPTGHVSNRTTTITRRVNGALHPYNTEGDLGWMNESDIQPAGSPTPTPTGLSVGDTVKIVGYGKASADGSGATAGGIGWTRQILKIYNGQPCPYMVGNNSGVTGFYPASSLQKL